MQPIDLYFAKLADDPSLLPAELQAEFPGQSFSTRDMYDVNTMTDVRVSTKFFPMNEVFEIILVCEKDIRTKVFGQKVVAVAGDPPDFFIKCVENCKDKLNRGQTLSLMIRCKNCNRARRPQFNWHFNLLDLPEEDEVDDYRRVS